MNKMFVFNVRATAIRFCIVSFLSVIALLILISHIPAYESDVINTLYTQTGEIKYDKIKTNADRIDFLEQFGWQTAENPTEEVKITIPRDFDKVMLAYNEIQRQQGLDLNKYKGKDVMRYTYEITNYPNYDGKVFANVIVFRNKVIGGDICSAEYDGFIGGFQKE